MLRNVQEERNSLTPRRKPEITHSLSLVLSQKQLNEIQNLRNKGQRDALFTVRKHIPMHGPESVKEIQNLTPFSLRCTLILFYHIYIYILYPQAGGPPLVGCPRLLIQFIRSYPPYRRPFLYPQPEDAPCRSDRDPLHGYILYTRIVTLKNGPYCEV